MQKKPLAYTHESKYLFLSMDFYSIRYFPLPSSMMRDFKPGMGTGDSYDQKFSTWVRSHRVVEPILKTMFPLPSAICDGMNDRGDRGQPATQQKQQT